MRNIKFRAWNKEKKDMIYSDRGNYVMELDGKCSFVGWGGTYFKPFPNLILMQFTGLKDKNEKEIYEGDIVENEESAWFKGVVKYLEPSFIIDAGKEDNYELESMEWSDTKVIGNICENPELLHDSFPIKNEQGGET